MTNSILVTPPEWVGREPTNPLIRISFFFSKLPTQSYSEFYEYWRNTHGRLGISIKAFLDCDVQRYVQVRNCHELNGRLKEVGLEQQSDFTWDGCSELYVKKCVLKDPFSFP